jgi:21S rRNA (uridine2791-2'-O)-methyltransferase
LQVALERTKPSGRVIGIDLLPAQPPRGVNTIQGDFLSPIVQKLVKNFINDLNSRQPPGPVANDTSEDANSADLNRPSYIDIERHASQQSEEHLLDTQPASPRLVDVRSCPIPPLYSLANRLL